MFNPILHKSRFEKYIVNRLIKKFLFFFFLANYLLESIDESIEPCENFFKFACGTWLKNNRIPDDG